MRFFLPIFISFNFFICQKLEAQQISEAQMKQALISWQMKATDSIKNFRTQSEQLRTEMRSLVKQLKHEPMFILGPEESWIREDMNLLFREAPSPMKVYLERDLRQTSLENKHVALYWADLKVYRWKKIKHTVDSVAKLDTPLATWLEHQNDTDNQEKISNKQAEKTLKKMISYKLWSENTAFFPEGNILLPKPKVKLQKENPNDFIISNSDVDRFLKESYPAQGQYNFYINEDLNYKGYAYFQRDSFSLKMGAYQNENWDFYMVWTDKKKYHHEEGLQLDLDLGESKEPGFDFSIPKDLKPATFYQLQIIGKVYDSNIQKYKKVIVWNNYIRTSKYSIVDKILILNEQRPVYDRKNGTFEVEIDEPFDVIELSGVNNNGKKLLEFSTESSTSQSPMYFLEKNEIESYLKTPKITPVDTTNLDNIPTAESDNTANSAALRNLNKADSYRSSRSYYDEYSPDTIKVGTTYFLKKDLVEQDTILGSYFAPKVAQLDFENGKISMPKSFKYNIGVSGLKKQYEVARVLNKLILDRATERANYFYQLDVRAWKRDKTKERPVLAKYQKTEIANLPSGLRAIVAFSSSYPFIAKVLIEKNSREDRRFVNWGIEILR